MKRRSVPFALVAATLGAVLLAAPVGAASTTVEMRALSYAPSTVTLPAPGRQVRWLNVTNPNRLHDAISSLPDYFGSSLISSGGSYTFRFDAAGTFTYICSIHDVMLGAIAVTPGVAVVTEGDDTVLRLTLGTTAWPVDAAYRWSVLVRGPDDPKLVWRRMARRSVIDWPVTQAGEYQVMVRLRHRESGRPSGDSPIVSVVVPA